MNIQKYRQHNNFGCSLYVIHDLLICRPSVWILLKTTARTWPRSQHTKRKMWNKSQHTKRKMWTKSQHTKRKMWTKSQHTKRKMWTTSQHTKRKMWTFEFRDTTAFLALVPPTFRRKILLPSSQQKWKSAVYVEELNGFWHRTMLTPESRNQVLVSDRNNRNREPKRTEEDAGIAKREVYLAIEIVRSY
jgi:hypothetical protein